MRRALVALLVACGGTVAPDDAGLDASAADASAGVTAVVANVLTCAIKDGAVWCWGVSADGHTTATPTQAPTIPPSKALCAPSLDMRACALTASGDVFCWGLDVSGEVGVTPTTGYLPPTKVAGLPTMSAIACGEHHTCALSTSGDVYCWGDDMYGALGDGATDGGPPPVKDTSTPVVAGIHGVTAIAAGENFTCAVKSGEVWCWGYLPPEVGNATFAYEPTRVTALGGVTAISAALEMICAIAQGRAFCWGSGMLGDGNPAAQTSTPAMVTNVGDAVAVSIGGAHGCVLDSGGALHCWGNDSYGQLGDGKTVIEEDTPVAVPVPPVAAVSAAGLQTCAVTQTGRAICFGQSAFADGGDLLVPTEIAF